MKNKDILEEEEKLEQQALKASKRKRAIATASVAVGALAVAGVVTGIVLSQPVYYNVSVTDSIEARDPSVTANDKEAGKWEKGETVTLDAEAIPGYSFLGWYLDGVLQSTALSYEFKLNAATQGDYEARYEALHQQIEIDTASQAGGALTPTLETPYTDDVLVIDTTSNKTAQDGEFVVDATIATGYEVSKVTLTLGDDTVEGIIDENGVVYVTEGTGADQKLVEYRVPATGENKLKIGVDFVKVNYKLQTEQKVARFEDEVGGRVTITKSGESVGEESETFNYNDKVTVTIAENLGYEIASIQVVDEDGKTIYLNTTGNSSATFTAPANNVKVIVSYNPVLGVGSNLDSVETKSSTKTTEEGQTLVILETEGSSSTKTFIGWTTKALNGVIASTDYIYSYLDTPEADHVYYAVYATNNQTTIAGENVQQEIGKYFNYEILENTEFVEITGLSTEHANATEIVIPKEITVGTGSEAKTYAVVSIADAASGNTGVYTGGVFRDKEEITSIKFEENSALACIGKAAFYHTSITEIELPASVLKLGEAAFRDCRNLVTADFSKTSIKKLEHYVLDQSIYEGAASTYSLKNLFLPSTITSIGRSAFHAQGLESLDLSHCEKLTYIGAQAFESCINIREVKLPVLAENIGNEFFSSWNGTSEWVGVSGVQEEEFTKINGHEFRSGMVISSLAFNNCKAMFTITLPRYINTIGKDAFKSCTKLYEVVMNNSVFDIGTDTVRANIGINITITNSDGSETYQTTIVEGIGSKVVYNGDFGFYEYASGLYLIDYLGEEETIDLTNITVRDFGIGGAAFMSNKNLKSVIFVDNILSIQQSAFKSCSNITKIDLSMCSKLTYIGDDAFNGCSKITEFIMPTENKIQEIGKRAFTNCRAIRTLDLSNTNITKLSESVFQETKRLETLILPNTLMTIEKYALGRMDRMTIITIPASVETIDVEAFITGKDGNPSAARLIEVVNYSQAASGQLAAALNAEKLTWPNGLTKIYNVWDTSVNYVSRITTTEAVTSTENEVVTIREKANGETANPEVKFVWYTENDKTYFVGCFAPNYQKYNLILPTKEGGYSIMNSAAHYEDKLLSLTLSSSVVKQDETKAIGDYAFKSSGLTTLIIDSRDAFEQLTGTGLTDAGAILVKNSTIKVLTSIIVPEKVPEYITNKYTSTIEGNYTVYTKNSQS